MTTVDFAATETEPGFGVSMTLPDGWNIGGENETYYPGLTGDTVAIVDADGNKVGYIGSIFYPDYTKEEDPEQYPAPFSENYWQLVYPELRLPEIIGAGTLTRRHRSARRSARRCWRMFRADTGGR